MQKIVVWGMKCVSYDYNFESDLVAKWQALDLATPQGSGETKRSGTQGKNRRSWRKEQATSDDSDSVDGGDVLTGRSRGHLARKVRRGKRAPHYGDSAAASGAEESSDEDDLLYHDADVGDFSDVGYT